MTPMTEQEIEAVLNLEGPARFECFVQRVADAQCAWGLWQNGWALMADDDEIQVFPLWPAPEYADRCRLGEWAEYTPHEIPLAQLLDDLLPALARRGILPGVFPTPAGLGVPSSVEELGAALRQAIGPERHPPGG